MRPDSGDIDPISGRMMAVQRALLTETATTGRYGVSVRVRADGTVESVDIDQTVTPYGAELGALIVELAREALNQVRDNARERIEELTADPRIRSVVEALGDATQRPRPAPASTPRFIDPDDGLTEEELTELNERRNRSFFQS
ncbi:YbaB/EbfC family nucleoid-associated protein [Nocardia brevicatena]|uniref:YbaB/EbfC family nucleoid-associated protein n=1 Tax=Nocardia brevicatena TaxID=37327 RepID=UPI0002E84E94|nr:YbaB/EbfC family nucleoid-associated protein [Nocardia brevicatena]